MRVFLACIAVLACVSCAAPLTEEEKTTAAFLAVVQDFSAAQAPKIFCLSPLLSYRDSLSLPQETREALVETGFQFVDSSEPQDTSVRILTLRPIREGIPFINVSVDLMETMISRGSVRAWATAWEYTLECAGDGCEVLGKTVAEHIDFASDSVSPRARAILAGLGARCPRG